MRLTRRRRLAWFLGMAIIAGLQFNIGLVSLWQGSSTPMTVDSLPGGGSSTSATTSTSDSAATRWRGGFDPGNKLKARGRTMNCHKLFSIDPQSGLFGNLTLAHAAAAGARHPANVLCWNHSLSGFLMCHGSNLRLDMSRIRVSDGGEDPEAVLGRSEDEELLTWESGALQGECIAQHSDLPKRWDGLGKRAPYSKLQCVDSLGSDDDSCDEWVEERTIMVERLDYANFWFVNVDWFNIWTAAIVAGWIKDGETPYQRMQRDIADGTEPDLVAALEDVELLPFRVIWLDGHAKGTLDDAWGQSLSSRVDYVSSLGRERRVCFRNVVMLDNHYTGPFQTIKTRNQECKYVAEVMAYSRRIVRALGLANTAMQDNLVVIINRTWYRAHPRKEEKKDPRRWEDVEQSAAALRQAMPDLDVRIVSMDKLGFRQQVELVMQARLLIGVHGAGLTHALFLNRGAALFELRPPSRRDNFNFRHITQMCGITYDSLDVGHIPAGVDVHTDSIVAMAAELLDRRLGDPELES